MYKNQLQELAQRSCFNLPSYACIREGPDHAPRFKATVNFNGEVFESPAFCTTLRQAEHAAAEVALNALFRRGLSRTLAVKVLDETGVYKNLLQETAHRAGLKLPVYTTVRSGPGHTPIFSCTVELGGMSFSGEPAKTKKQAQKNAAMAAWSALKQLPHSGSSFSSSSSPSEHEPNDEQEQVIVACALASLHQSEANKQSTQTSDRQHNNHRRSAVVRRDMNPTSDYSYYPRPCHSWTYPSFNSDATMYHMWQQSQASQQQSHLLTLPAPPHPADPRFLPLLRSMIQPAQGQFYSGIGQDCISPMPCFPQSTIPVLPTYFSDYSSSPTARSRSQVTIQEINEEKNQLEEKDWLCGGTPDAAAAAKPTTPRTSNLQPDASLASEVSSDRETDIALTGFNPVPSGSDTSMANESSVSTKIQEKQMDRSPRKPFKCRTQNPHPSGPGVNHPPSAGSARPRGFRPPHNMSVPMRSGFRAEGLKPSMAAPVMIRTAIPVCSARPSTVNYMAPHKMSVPMRSGFRAEGLRPRSSSMAAPVTMRTAVPVCSARPSTVNYMAPAVHVRTIVPVCSAPPVRAPDSTQKKSSQDAEGSRGG